MTTVYFELFSHCALMGAFVFGFVRFRARSMPREWITLSDPLPAYVVARQSPEPGATLSS
eukprot:76304-Pyramimonas_sp.AAC.1